MRRVLWIIALAVLTVLTIRFICAVAATETGHGIVTEHVRQLVPRMFGHDDFPISERDPAEQADFWLAEIERISAERPLSASESMGAAWMLNEPGRGFWKRHIRFPRADSADPLAALIGSQLDHDAIDRKTSIFEGRCREPALSLADIATEREPQNPAWWRLSAFLRFGSLDGKRLTPASLEGGLKWLEQANAHDPENGLYDLIGALLLYHSSADIDWSSDPPILQIQDARRFAEVDTYQDRLAARTIRSSHLVQPSAVNEFLRRTSLPVHRRLECGTVEFESLLIVLLRDFGRWQEVRSQVLVATSDFTAAVACWTRYYNLIDRSLADDEQFEVDPRMLGLRLYALANLIEVIDEYPDGIAAIDIKGLRQRRLDIRLESAVLKEAIARYNNSFDPRTHRSSSSGSCGLASAAWMLLISGLGLLAWYRLHRADDAHPSPLGIGNHVSVYLFAWALGFFILGFGMPPVQAESSLPKETGIWIRALIRWDSYPSIPFTLAGCLLIVSMWSVVRGARFRRESSWGFLTEGSPGRWAGVARNVANSALGLALGGALFYLIVTPSQIARIEVRTQALLGQIREPAHVADSLRELVCVIRQEPDTMQRIRSEIEQD